MNDTRKYVNLAYSWCFKVWKLKYQTRTLGELMEGISNYTARNLGDMFIIAAKIEESVPALIAGTGALRSQYGMGVCFIRYFKEVLMSPSIMLGDFLFWVPMDKLEIKASIMTYDSVEIQLIKDKYPGVVYNKYIAELFWDFKMVPNTFRIQCFRWDYNLSNPMDYETTTPKRAWWNVIGQAFDTVASVVDYAESVVGLKKWHYNPYYDKKTGTSIFVSGSLITF